MFKSVSWSSFITTVIILLVVYYIVIGILYFRNDVMGLLKKGIRKKSAPAPLSMPGADPKSDPVFFSSVHELMDELKELFFTAAAKHYPEEELVVALQGMLKRYIHLKGTSFEVAINSHIQQTASSVCNISLDDYAIQRVW